MNTQNLNSSLKKNSLTSCSDDINQKFKFCYFYKKRYAERSIERTSQKDSWIERPRDTQRDRGGEGMRDSEQARKHY